MKRSWALIAASLIVSTARANDSEAIPPSLTTEAQDLLENPRVTCDQLNTLAENLRKVSDQDALLKSISARLYTKRAKQRCLKPAPPGTTPPPTPKQTFDDVYSKLVDDVRQKRTECGSNASCPAAKIREEELARLTVHLARTLPEQELGRLRSAFQTIVIVVPVKPSIDQMIEQLGQASLAEEQASRLFEILATSKNEATLLHKVSDLLRKRRELDPLVLQTLLDALCGKSTCTKESIDQLLRIHVQLSNPQQRKTLERMLHILEKDFPGLKASARATLDQMHRNDPGAAKAITSLFSAVGPFVMLSIQLQADHNIRIALAPQSIRFIPMSIVRDSDLTSDSTCKPDEQFWNTYIQFLHFSFGGNRAFRLPVVRTAADHDEHDHLVERFGQLSMAVLEGRPLEDLPCSENPDVCQLPLPGTVLLSMRPSDAGKIAIQGSCWVDSTGEHRPAKMSLFEATVPTGCGALDEDQRRAQAARLAVEASGHCSLFKPVEGPDAAASSPPTTSSGWYALAFAGTPYLHDSRASTWSKIVPSVLDGALLLGAGVSFGLAIKYRNDYNAGRSSSLDPSARAFNTGVGLSIGLGVTRITSGILYEANF